MTEHEKTIAERLASSETELRSLRKQLDVAEARYDCVIRITGQVPFAADAEGILLSIGDRWEGWTGIPVEQAIGTSLFDWVYPEDQVAARDTWRTIVRDGDAYSLDFRLAAAADPRRWVRCRAERIDAGVLGAPHWRGVLDDIDELYRARREAQQNERRYRTAARATRDVIWDADLENGTIIFGETLQETLGHAEVERLLPLSWWEERLHPDDLEETRASFYACPPGARWVAEYRVQRGDGSYAIVQSRAFIRRDAQGEPKQATGAISDLTDERLMRARMEKLRADMLDSSRSGTVGALAGMLAHELNQPLTALTNYVRGARRLLQQDDFSRDRVQAALESAASSAIDAGALVQRMRELISRGEGRLTVERLGRIATNARALTILQNEQSNLRIAIEDGLEDCKIVCDRIQTHQVFLNLLRNAAEATARTPAPFIEVRAAQEGEFVRVSIVDNGPGFGTTKPDEVFTPFLTTKMHGVGIGLAICKMIIEAQGGRIWAEERAAGGAAFHFTLPLSDGENMISATDARSGRPSEDVILRNPEPSDAKAVAILVETFIL